MPFYWIVDPRGRTIDAFTLVEGAYRLAGRLEGNEPKALAPFLDLTLDPAVIWV